MLWRYIGTIWLPNKWIEGDILARISQEKTHKLLSKKLKFLKENAQIPRGGRTQIIENRTERWTLSSDLSASEVVHTHERERGSGKRNNRTRNSEGEERQKRRRKPGRRQRRWRGAEGMSAVSLVSSKAFKAPFYSFFFSDRICIFGTRETVCIVVCIW